MFRVTRKKKYFSLWLYDQLDIQLDSLGFFFSVFRNSFFFLLIHFQHSVLPISKTALIQATSSPFTANFDRHFHFSYLISSEHLTLDLFLLQTFSCLWRAHFSSLSFRLCVTFPYTPCFLLVLKSCSSS